MSAASPADGYPLAPDHVPTGFGQPDNTQPYQTPLPQAPGEARRGGWATLGVESGVAVALAVVIGLLGFPLGALWSAISPHAPAVIENDGAYLSDPEAEHRIAQEGWYIIITGVAGLVIAILVWMVLRRFRGVGMAFGLAAGTVAAGLITYGFGHHLGRAAALQDIKHGAVGTTFTLPVGLYVQKFGLWHGWLPYARGDVLFMAFIAMFCYVIMVGFSPYPALRATHIETDGQVAWSHPEAPWSPANEPEPEAAAPWASPTEPAAGPWSPPPTATESAGPWPPPAGGAGHNSPG